MKRIITLLLVCACICGCFCACSQEKTVVRLKEGSILYCLVKGAPVSTKESVDACCEPYTTSDPAVWKNAILWKDRYDIVGMYATKSATPGTILQKDWFSTTKPDSATDINIPTAPPVRDDLNEPETPKKTYNLIYSNEGVYLEVPAKDILEQIGDEWKNPDKMAAAEAAKIEYIAKCGYVSTRITQKGDKAYNNQSMLYSWEADWDLFSKQETVKFYASSLGELIGWDAVDAFQKDSATFVTPDLELKGSVAYGSGKHQETVDFVISGKCALVNKTDETKLPHTQIRLTNTGFEVDIPYDLLLQEAGWTIEELNSKNATEILYCRSAYTYGPTIFQSKQAKMTIDTTNRPGILTVIIEYSSLNGYQTNGEALYKMALEKPNTYVSIDATYICGRVERYADFRMRCEVIDARTE